MHELGHALKLEHPTEETEGIELNYPCIMQCATGNAGCTNYITTVDIGSLIKKWGE